MKLFFSDQNRQLTHRVQELTWYFLFYSVESLVVPDQDVYSPETDEDDMSSASEAKNESDSDLDMEWVTS